jgi:DNA-binding FadR family transcriptional regulator
MDFVKINKVSKSEEVFGYLQEQILSRRIKPGEKLPVEETLAEKMGVGRGTVREALKVLIHLGLVERKNNGTYVTEGAVVNDLRIEPFEYRDLIEVMEVRKVVEPALAKFAALRGDRDLIDRINEELSGMKNRAEDVEAFLLHDNIFHDLISQASGNVLFRSFLSSFGELMSKNQEVVLKRRFDQIMPKSLGYHERIFEAINRGESEKAYLEMEKHIEDVESEFMIIAESYNGGYS